MQWLGVRFALTRGVTGGMDVRPEVWALAGGQGMLAGGQGDTRTGGSGRHWLEVRRVH